jgi:hypothetical protein
MLFPVIICVEICRFLFFRVGMAARGDFMGLKRTKISNMAGLARICKMFGQMSVKDANGKEVLWVYDYAKDKPRLKSEMTKEEFALSEKAKWMGNDRNNPLTNVARGRDASGINEDEIRF